MKPSSRPAAGGGKTYADIDGRHLKSLIAEITTISSKSRASGDKMWGRIAGMSGEKMTNDWVESKFRALGLEDVHRQPFNLPPSGCRQTGRLRLPRAELQPKAPSTAGR